LLKPTAQEKNGALFKRRLLKPPIRDGSPEDY